MKLIQTYQGDNKRVVCFMHGTTSYINYPQRYTTRTSLSIGVFLEWVKDERVNKAVRTK